MRSILLPHLAAQWRLLCWSVCLSIACQVLLLLDPLILRYLVDSLHGYSQGSAPLPLGRLMVLLSTSLVVLLLALTARSYQELAVNCLSRKIGSAIYSDGIGHILSVPLWRIEQHRTGELLSKLGRARSEVEQFIPSALNIVFPTAVGMLFVTVYALGVNRLLALAFAVFIPVVALVSVTASRSLGAISKTLSAETASLVGSATESLRNIELVKAMGLRKQEMDRLGRATEQLLRVNVLRLQQGCKVHLKLSGLVNILRVLLLLLVLYPLFRRTETVGEFFALFLYSQTFFGPLLSLGAFLSTIPEVSAILTDCNAIMKIPADPNTFVGPAVQRLREIRAEGMSFSHPSSSNCQLTNISFSVSSGQTIAFVGPSGAGKTTLLKLLTCLYNPDRGTLSYNGVDVRCLDPEEIRAQIGLVAQETQLFAGTIRDNLLFSNPQATDLDCLAALASASAMNIIERSGQGLNAVIGENGAKISGGEKQRLALARALVRKPTLLILDEATSALDFAREEAIMDTVRRICLEQNIMVILVAHRYSTARHADCIYVLNEGALEQVGSHAELAGQVGFYSSFWPQQTPNKENH